MGPSKRRKSLFSEDALSPDDRTINTMDRIDAQTSKGNPLTADLTLAKLHATKSPEGEEDG